MTNMPVLDRGSAAQNILSNKGTGKTALPADGAFDTVLKQASTQDVKPTDSKQASNVEEMKKPVKTQETKETSEKEKTEEAVGNDAAKETGSVEKQPESVEEKAQTGEENAQEATEDVTADIAQNTELLEKAGGEMAAMLAAQMGLPPEVVAQAMEELGMTEVSLLDPKNVKELMVHLTEGADHMSVLTDENFYEAVTKALGTLQEITENLSEETGMTLEEINEAIQALKKQTVEAKPEEMQPIVEETSFVQEESATAAKQPERENTETPVMLSGEAETEETQAVKTQTGQESKADTEAAEKDMPKKAHEAKEDEHPLMESNYSSVQTRYTAANIEARVAEAENVFSTVTTREIMDQIVDYMKVSMKPEMTSLEMRLTPENLGTLHIQISNKEGAVTAQFIAQNESVRAALESRVMELRENLEQQGVKVEAVEVTIAQYSLERNPEGDREASGQGGRRGKGARNLDLRELNGEETQDLTAEERLTAEMMQAAGNVINYTA